MHLPLGPNETSRIESLRSFRVLETSREQVFDDIVRLAVLICDTPVSVIAFVDEQRVWFKAKTGLETDEIPRDGSFCTYAILQSAPLIIQDPLSDERFVNNFLVSRLGIQFYAGIPLTTADLHCIGTLAVMDQVPHLLTAEQIDSLQILARRTIAELESRRRGEAQSPQRELHLARRPQLSGTIMLVEDNQNLRDLLLRTFEGAGFSVFSATDGAEAVRLWREHEGTINLVVTDIAMPQLNGLELADRISATHPEIKFLFMTGFAYQFPELDQLIKKGASILEKPFLPSEIVHRVEEMLNQRNTTTGTEG